MQKCTKILFRVGLCSRPRWGSELTALPQPPSWILRALLLRKEDGRGREGRERERREEEGWKGKEGDPPKVG